MIRNLLVLPLIAIASSGIAIAQNPEAIYTFQGDISTSAPGSAIWGSAQVGDPFTVVIGVDSIPQGSPAYGTTYALTGVSISIGGVVSDGTFDISSNLMVANDTPTGLGCGDVLSYTVIDNSPAEFTSVSVNMFLSQVTCPTILSSNVLPMAAELPALRLTELILWTIEGSPVQGSVDTAGVSFGPVPDDELCNGGDPDFLGCGNCICAAAPPEGTIGGCINSSGRSARLVVSGSPSVTALDPMDLRFDMTGGTSSALAILASGDNLAPQNAANPCFGLGTGLSRGLIEGLRCVVGSVRREGGRAMDAGGDVGLTNSGWGGTNAPPGGIAAQSGYVAGQVRYFQVFYRESAMVGCGTGQNTTQAVRVTFQP